MKKAQKELKTLMEDTVKRRKSTLSKLKKVKKSTTLPDPRMSVWDMTDTQMADMRDMLFTGAWIMLLCFVVSFIGLGIIIIILI